MRGGWHQEWNGMEHLRFFLPFAAAVVVAAAAFVVCARGKGLVTKGEIKTKPEGKKKQQPAAIVQIDF